MVEWLAESVPVLRIRDRRYDFFVGICIIHHVLVFFHDGFFFRLLFALAALWLSLELAGGWSVRDI
jgi:hypothetical protein